MKIQFAFGANPRKSKKKSRKRIKRKGGAMAKHKRKLHRRKKNPTFLAVKKKGDKKARLVGKSFTNNEKDILLSKFSALEGRISGASKTRKGRALAKKLAKKQKKILRLASLGDKNKAIKGGLKKYYEDLGYETSEITEELNEKKMERLLMAKKKKAKKKKSVKKHSKKKVAKKRTMKKKHTKKRVRKSSKRRFKMHRHGKRKHAHSASKIKHVFKNKHYKGTLKLKGKAKRGEAKKLNLDIMSKSTKHLKKGKRTKLKGFKGKVKANPMDMLMDVKSKTMEIIEESAPILGAVAVAPFLAGATQTALNVIPGVSTVDGYLQQFTGGRVNVGHVGALALALGVGYAAKRYMAGNKYASIAAEGALAAAVLGLAQSLYGKEAQMLAAKVFPQTAMAGVEYFPMSGVQYFPSMSGEPQMGEAQMGEAQMGSADYLKAKVLVGREENYGNIVPAGMGDADYGDVDPVYDQENDDIVSF